MRLKVEVEVEVVEVEVSGGEQVEGIFDGEVEVDKPSGGRDGDGEVSAEDDKLDMENKRRARWHPTRADRRKCTCRCLCTGTAGLNPTSDPRT